MSGLNGNEPAGTQAAFSIEERSGAIVIFLGETYGVLPPQQAIDIGEELVRFGHHAKTGQDIDLSSSTWKGLSSDQHRKKLHTRVELVLKNLITRNTSPARITKEVIDIVLKEVL